MARIARSVGSSPRVRGKRGGLGHRLADPGLIPARAGKTSCGQDPRRGCGAHPRACGENSPGSPLGPGSPGSSPRVRGKRHPGNWRISCSTAHPRACGENSRRCAPTTTRPGSSPRVRGKRRRHDEWAQSPGLIPARAGKTPLRHHRPHQRWAHPRACGENSAHHARAVYAPGSSPRVRGKRRIRVSRRSSGGVMSQDIGDSFVSGHR